MTLIYNNIMSNVWPVDAAIIYIFYVGMIDYVAIAISILRLNTLGLPLERSRRGKKIALQEGINSIGE